MAKSSPPSASSITSHLRSFRGRRHECRVQEAGRGKARRHAGWVFESELCTWLRPMFRNYIPSTALQHVVGPHVGIVDKGRHELQPGDETS